MFRVTLLIATAEIVEAAYRCPNVRADFGNQPKRLLLRYREHSAGGYLSSACALRAIAAAFTTMARIIYVQEGIGMGRRVH